MVALDTGDHRRQPDARAWSALLGTFTATPNFAGYQYLPDAGAVFGAVVPGTSQAVVALDGRDLVLVDLVTGEIDDRFPPAAGVLGSYAELDVSADGRFVAEVARSGSCDFDFPEQIEANDGRGCQILSVHQMASGRRVLGPLSLPFGPDVALNHDGTLVAVAGGYTGKAAVYRVADGRLLRTFPGLERPAEAVNDRDTASVGFGPDERLFLGSMAGPIRVIDPASLEVVDTYDTPLFSSHNHMIVTADGLLVGGGDHAVVAVDTTTGTTRWAVDIQSPTYPEQCPWLAVAPEVGRLYCGGYFGQMEERDLATGQRTGLRFDPQLGSVGTLAITSDGRELVAFAEQAPVISHWRLDGSGPTTRLVAEGRFASQGYDPTGQALIVGDTADVTAASDNLDPAVWDPVADELLDPLDLPLRAANWLRSDLLTIVFQDGRVGTYDLNEHTASDLADQETFEGVDSGTLAADGDRLYLSFDQSQSTERHGEIRTIDPADGSRLDPTIEVDGRVSSLSTTADGSRLAVTIDSARTTIHNARTGDVVAGPLEGYGPTIISPDDVLVLAGTAGDILEYDIDTLEPIATLPRARGRIDILQFSTDGNVLAAMSGDQTVSLYDVPTRTRLGDPLPAATASPTSGIAEAFLRPDGTNVAINTRLGISLWDIDPAHLAKAACTLAGRNLTRTEWTTYLSGRGPYRTTCPDLPTPPEAPGLLEPTD